MQYQESTFVVNLKTFFGTKSFTVHKVVHSPFEIFYICHFFPFQRISMISIQQIESSYDAIRITVNIYQTIISIHNISSYSSIVIITVRNGNHETLEGLQNK